MDILIIFMWFCIYFIFRFKLIRKIEKMRKAQEVTWLLLN